MKSRKSIYSYSLKMVEQPIEVNGRVFSKTAKISLRDKNKNLLEKRKYGVYDVNQIYQQIHNGEAIDIQGCFISNFSIQDYRKKYKIETSQPVQIKNFNASNAFFESDKLVNFSNIEFVGEYTIFSNAHFGTGSLTFLKSKFQTSLVDFSDTSFGEGNNSFKYTEFSKGLVTFENASFINGNLSFVNASFNDGKTTFKNVNFGNGDVTFKFASFGHGIVNFERAIFRGILTDFSKVDFGTGKVDFRRANFGNSEVSFEEIALKDNRLIFRRAKFGSRPLIFKNSELLNSEIILDETEFASGRVSFFGVKASRIALKSTILSGYIDFRVEECEVIDLSNAIIHNIIDFKKGITKVKIERLYIYSVRNLGKLFIHWEENDIPKIIGQQTKTTYFQKAEQYRILKEDFHTMGQYEDEDRAYIEFKRNELKDRLQASKKKPFLTRLSTYLSFGFQKLIFDWMGKYATSPVRVLVSIFTTYGIFSMLYILLEFTNHGHISCMSLNMTGFERFVDSFYFSAVTFLTIGYGDCIPTGAFKVIAPMEGWVGVFMMSNFTVAFARKILR